jgi:malonyl-CoA O-methyltransferase
MNNNTPPTLDSQIVQRFKKLQSGNNSPWLHEEVARRMGQRLDFFKDKPRSWIDWEPINGGIRAHEEITKLAPHSKRFILEHDKRRALQAQMITFQTLTPKMSWMERLLKWGRFRGKTPCLTKEELEEARNLNVDLIWANMALHFETDPKALIKKWHENLNVGGWVMFSCLGPDTTVELRKIYQKMGWTHASHEFTDMHDWGDMLIESGFSDPVMDMERIILTYSNVDNLLIDLASIGKNFHKERFKSLRGRVWLDSLKKELIKLSSNNDPNRLNIPITFEIIYGHAFKISQKLAVASETSFSADQMRSMLKESKTINLKKDS